MFYGDNCLFLYLSFHFILSYWKIEFLLINLNELSTISTLIRWKTQQLEKEIASSMNVDNILSFSKMESA